MIGRIRSIAIVGIAVVLVVSTPAGYVGIGSATTVTAADAGDAATAYPGQTVSALNVSVVSEDEQISDEEDPQYLFGVSSTHFSGPKTGKPELYIDSGKINGKYDTEDAIVRFQILSNYENSSPVNSQISYFKTDSYFIDTDQDSAYSPHEPIIRDSSTDGKVDTSDVVIYSGTQPIKSFSSAKNNEVYLDGDASGDGLEINDPVFKTGSIGGLQKGPLDTGETKLLRKGSTFIRGFDSEEGDVYFMDSVGSDGTEYEDGEAIISDNGSGKIEVGQLSLEDKIIKPGSANLKSPRENRIFFVDEVEPDKDEYNPSEAIIKDTGDEVGQLDSNDDVIFKGYDHVSDFDTSIATFGDGDVYIGNSDNAVLDGSKFVYVEASGSDGYDAGEDLVLSIAGENTADSSTNKVTQISADVKTNVGFLDLNNNGQLDTVPETNASSGSEPIVKYILPQKSLSENVIDTDTTIVSPHGDDPASLDVGGKLLEGSKYQDVTNSTGPNQNGEIVYSDSKSGNIDELDSGELLVEKAGTKNILTENDYVIRNVPINGISAEYLPNNVEYFDVDRDGKFAKSDYIIESSTPDDKIISEHDTIISVGGTEIGSVIEPNFEFVDTNQNEEYNIHEPILKSANSGDDLIEPTDEFYMSSSAPGNIRLVSFEQNQESDDEIYIDSGNQAGEIDHGDIVGRFTILKSGSFDGEPEGESMNEFRENLVYVDTDNDEQYSEGDLVYQEGDENSGKSNFGNTLTALTVSNKGTAPDEAIESVALKRNDTEIATASARENGAWTLEPETSADFGPGEGATFEVTATLAADAPVDSTVEMAITEVDDGGVPGDFDPGDQGLYFADGPPAGNVGTGPTFSIADADDIDATAIAYPDPNTDSEDATAIELAFTDGLDPATTTADDFAVETSRGERVNVTGLDDDDADERLVLEMESDAVPSTIESVSVGAGALSVRSGAAVPERTVDVETGSVTITEAAARPHVVYAGERVAVLANDGENGSANHDEAVRIEKDTTGDGTVDDLVQLGSTGSGSQVTVFDTAAEGADDTTYRVTFESEDGSPGETVRFPVRNLSIDVTANRTNTTDVAGPIGATIEATGGDRSVRADLLDLDGENETVLASTVVDLDARGNGTVAFPARVANVSIAVTDLGTGHTNRTANITVRKGYPGATFTQDVFEEHRGDIAQIEVRLVDTTNATLTIGGERVNYRERVTVVDSDGDGRAVVTVNTHRAGAGAAGTGVGILGNDRYTGTSADSQQGKTDEIVGVDRAFPPGKGLDDPLETGAYPLKAAVDGEVTDLGELRVEERATSDATTLVAPAGVDLDSAADVENWTTPRETVAVGDQAIVAVNASGLGGFLNESTDLRRGSRAAANTGAYVSVQQGNPPPNRPARKLNVSNASTVLDRGGDSLYLVVPSAGDTHAIEAGERFDATFVLNETSPYVGGDGSPDTVERESAETSVAFETPSGRFAALDANETVDLPATANATIGGETNVAPGTRVTVTIASDDENVTFQESDTDRVEDDGSFETTTDLEEYPEGTEYTVVASANDDDITEVRTGEIVESSIETDAAMTVTASGAGGAGGGQSAAAETETRATTKQTTVAMTTTDDGPDSVGDRAAEFVTRDVPEFITTQATNIVVGLGILAVLYGLLGLRRLTR